MAQLTDDCFAFSGPLMPIDEAERLIAQRVVPVAEIERVPLRQGQRRVVAADVVAPINLPSFDNSAVDGYAVRHADVAGEGETSLAVVGRITAGLAAQGAVAAGQAIRIFTGAPMPEGADTVFMQEDCRVENGSVVLPPGLKQGANRRLAGEDVRAGTVVLPAGRFLAAQDVALAAALGLTELPVRRRVRVAIFSTGDEIMDPGSTLRPAALYDANRFLLAGMLERLNVDITDLGILPDDPERLRSALAAAARGHDLVLTSGGVSTGEADHVRRAVEQAGSLVFWRIGIKPGRPVAMGVVAGTPFVGLPGNPVAVFVTFATIARAMIARLAGEAYAPPRTFPVVSGFAYRTKEGRREYVRVGLESDAQGRLVAQKHPREGAGVISSLTETDGLVELPEAATRIEPGEVLRFLPYDFLA